MTAPSPAYSAFVRAAEARFPRGGVCVFGAWYAVSCAALVWGAKPAAWFGSVAVVAFAAAAVTTIWVQFRPSGLKRGVMLEVLVNASAAPVSRSRLRQFADLAFMFAVPVTGISRNTPALVVPRPNPARYRIPLIQVSGLEVHAALAQLGAETSIAALD